MLNDFVAGALASGRIDILSDGTPWRPLIHVEDMSRAMSWAAARDAGAGGDFLAVNTGSDGWNHQVRDLADAVAAAIPGTEITVNPDAPPDRRSYRVDFGLYRRLAPEAQPRITLEAAIEGLRDGLAGAGFDDARFRESQLVRLRTLAAHRERGALDAELRWAEDAR